MTKEKFAEQILQTVDNARDFDGHNDKQIVETLARFISVLKPKDLENFAKWGTKDQHSTKDKCW